MPAFSLAYRVTDGNMLSESDFLDLYLIYFRARRDQEAPFLWK